MEGGNINKEEMKMKYTRFLLMTLALLLCTATLAVAGSEAPYGIQVVRQPAILIEQEGYEIGTAEYWNTRNNFIVRAAGGWRLADKRRPDLRRRRSAAD